MQSFSHNNTKALSKRVDNGLSRSENKCKVEVKTRKRGRSSFVNLEWIYKKGSIPILEPNAIAAQ